MVITEKIDIQWNIFEKKSKFSSKFLNGNSKGQINIDCDGKETYCIFSSLLLMLIQ